MLAALVVICLVVAVAQARRWVIVRSYVPGLLPVCRVATSLRVVALSFDDGPNPRFTRPILTILHRRGARATFFAVGSRVAAEPESARAEISASMEVADHTWSHPHLGSIDPTRLRTELERTDAALDRRDWVASAPVSAAVR